MESTTVHQSTNDYQEKVRDWFDNYLAEINADRLMMETGTAPHDTRKHYEDMMFGNELGLAMDMRILSSKKFLIKLLDTYLRQLKKRNAKPIDLAFDLSEAKILVWAKINDNDDNSEDAFILAEAEANKEFYQYGFYVASTITEKSDGLKVPPHYNALNPQKIGLV